MATITGTNGDNNRDGTANNDVMNMLGGNDTASGGGGDDTIYGGDGADKLYGGAGADDLHGGAGRDVLAGGGGVNSLWGGDGADRFLFTSTVTDDVGSGQAITTVHDFSRAEGDRIDVSDIDANWNAAGNNAFRYLGETSFTGHAGEIISYRYDLNGGQPGGVVTMIELDVDGDRQADLNIGLTGNHVLQSGDFIL